MSLYRRRSSPYWYYEFYLNGKRYRGSTGETNKRTAQDHEAMVRTKAKERAQRVQVVEEMTVYDAVQRYLKSTKDHRDHRRQEGRARKLFGEKYDKAEGGVVRVWGLPTDLMLHDLTKAHISRLKEERRNEGMAANTINLEIALLQRVCNVAHHDWGVRTNRDLSWKGAKTPVKGKLRYLSEDEEARMLQQLDPTREGPGLAPYGSRLPAVQAQLQDGWDLAVLLLDTGARVGEITSLRWDQIELNRGCINLYRSKVANAGLLGMTERVREVMVRRYAERTTPWVFPEEDKRGPKGSHMGRVIKYAMDRAGLNDPETVAAKGKATAHTLRDTFASRLAQDGLGLYKVQQLLGHTTPVMTQKYAHLDMERVAREAADLLNVRAG